MHSAPRRSSSPLSRRAASALAGVLLLGLAACAGTSQVVRQPLQGNLKAYGSAVIRVDEKVDEDVAAEMTALRDRVVSGLEKKKLFQLVSDNGAVEASDGGAADSRLQIHATITNVRKVSSSSRFWGGAFAGKARVTVTVELLDAQGARLASYDIEGTSGSTGMSGGTDDAVASAANGIVDLLVDLRKRG